MRSGHRPLAGQTREAATPLYDVQRVRRDFPILARRVHDKPLVYLDNAASSQKPARVVDAVNRYYLSECSNVHRGLHELSVRATESYEAARASVQQFIGAGESREIVFTKGTTESINLVAHSYGERHIRHDDEILISEMEHHSNIVPWQLLCERTGARLRVAPVDDAGELQLEELERLLGPRTRLVAITHVSNALGTRNPVERIVELAHASGAAVLIDGAQAVPHERVNVQALDCDFYAFSGHKLYGPTGIGVLYGKASLLEDLPPFQGGGDMIRSVSFEKTTYNELPYKYEAGTPNIAGAIGLGAAVDYMDELGLERVGRWEQELVAQALERLADLPRVRLLGAPAQRGALISFNVSGIHPHDVGTVLDHEGIAVRAGHHCAQPLMARYGVPATVRVSFGCYSLPAEIDCLVAGIEKVIQVLG